jgi:hypothetical protein
MILLLALLVQDAPWTNDVQTVRKANKPCVIILHVDSSAL